MDDPDPPVLFIPNDPFFRELFSRHVHDPEACVIHDRASERSVTPYHFLVDILQTSDWIHRTLGLGEQTPNSDNVFVCVLVSYGYEYAVTVFALRALGLTAVPVCKYYSSMNPTIFQNTVSRPLHLVPNLTCGVHGGLAEAILPEEFEHFVQVCGATSLITTTPREDHAKSLLVGISLTTLTIQLSPSIAKPWPVLRNSPQVPKPWDPDRGAILLFTSGTSGPPKGVLHTHQSVYTGAKEYLETYRLTRNDRTLLPWNSHWCAGFMMLSGCILAGAYAEICPTVFSPAWFWERIKAAEITYLHLTPGLLGPAIEWYAREITHQSLQDVEEYLAGLKRLRTLITGSIAVPASVANFWIDKGVRVDLHYGSTECWMITGTDWREFRKFTPRCVGKLVPSVQTTLPNGSEGEIAIKSQGLFQKYLSASPHIMNNVFDKNGYYRTGDFVRCEDDGTLFILGRASQDGEQSYECLRPFLRSFDSVQILLDCRTLVHTADHPIPSSVIRFSGYKVFALDVEDALLKNPHISTAVVLGVADHTVGQRISALIVIEPTSSQQVSLATLRRSLALEQHIAVYKLPTLLRVLDPWEEIPQTQSGKVSKAAVREKFFSSNDVASEKVEVWDLKRKDEGFPGRAWDWAGIGEGATPT